MSNSALRQNQKSPHSIQAAPLEAPKERAFTPCGPERQPYKGRIEKTLARRRELGVEQAELSLNTLHQACHSKATNRDYGIFYRCFARWCQENKLPSLPAESATVARYLAEVLRSGRSISTAIHYGASIRHAHVSVGLANPLNDDNIRKLIRGAKRTFKEAPQGKKALTLEHLQRICEKPAVTEREIRDRAIILIGFAAALRRSEITGLNVDDIRFDPRGYIIYLRQSKTDQFGKGCNIAVKNGKNKETCPADAMRRWVEIRGNRPGPLFPRLINKTCKGKRVGNEVIWPGYPRLDGAAVCVIVRSELARIGVKDLEEYGAHSLRAGYVTAAGEAGVNELTIMRTTRHKTIGMVQRYFRPADLFNGCESSVGL